MKTVQLVEGGHLLYAADHDERETDNWMLDQDYHNGPACALCKDAWCEHCYPDRETEQCPKLAESALFDITDYSETYQPWRTANLG